MKAEILPTLSEATYELQPRITIVVPINQAKNLLNAEFLMVRGGIKI